jgi:hypothetical protein
LLSLATCKPAIREKARQGDIVLMYAGKRLCDERRLLGWFVVSKVVPVREYHSTPLLSEDEQSHSIQCADASASVPVVREDVLNSRRPDQVYDFSKSQPVHVRGVCDYHLGDALAIAADVSAPVLVAEDFRLFASSQRDSNPGVPPAALQGIDDNVKIVHPHSRGQKCKQLSDADADALLGRLRTACRPYEKTLTASRELQVRIKPKMQYALRKPATKAMRKACRRAARKVRRQHKKRFQARSRQHVSKLLKWTSD